MTEKIVRTLLEKNIHPHWLKVETKLINPLLREYQAWLKKTAPQKEQAVVDQTTIAESLVKFIYFRIDQELSTMTLRHEQYTEFNKRYSQAIYMREQKEHILDFAKTLGANRWQLWGDKKAFSRWFGQDAIIGRYQRMQTKSTRKLSFYLKRLGVVASIVLNKEDKWRALDLERHINPLLTYVGDYRVRLEAFRCLLMVIKKLPEQVRENSLTPDTLQQIYRASVDYRQNVWIQCEALNLIECFSLETLQVVLQKRFKEPGDDDDLFVRRHAVNVLGRNFDRLPALVEVIPLVVQDESPFVRQALAKALATAPIDQVQTYLRQLALEDKIAPVRAATLLEILTLLTRTELNDFLLTLLTDSLAKERDTFVLRTALKVATSACITKEGTQHWIEPLLNKIEKIHSSPDQLEEISTPIAIPVEVRRWAAQAAEQLWCQMEAQTLRARLQEQLSTLKPAQRQRLKEEVDDTTLARVLSVLSQEDFGYDVVQNWFSKTVIRGHLFGFKLWRLIHEFRHPDPSKRQGFQHTTGRHFPGHLRIPSGILSELAETKVPGEPLFMGSEGGWRPYLPLVDELIDCLRQCEVHIYTSEGITTLERPKKFIRRLQARWKLTRHFARYAHLRNWNEQSQSPASAYIEALQSLGFTITYQSHTYPNMDEFRADPAVLRFFQLVLPFGDFGELKEFWARLQEYFFSVYQNTVQDLSFFALFAFGYFFAKHWYANHLLNRTRANIPLVVGGWGTRGKSGTERIKAAMFNALGYSVFSKTTGCEAMFLHASAFEPTQEMFLFRPYDKATIWEQYNVLRQADKMNMDIFLWECMGLTPSYVEILQKQWTRDDISTITNTYPDHEDLQGPAGINIPQVMTNFIPRNAILVTTEEQMLPILQTAANDFNTRLRAVNWLQAGLLTSDVLQRFPYEEHPYNIALVQAVGDELGIDGDFALKEMADNVVLDLGVLKSYPIALIQTRRLEFVMGMSANERFGALGNWSRMGFKNQDPKKEPDVWLSTLVNNRADRIARSRVFASLLVEDISADMHVLIGTNLTGMVGYIRETWESYALKQTLWPEDQQEAPLENLQNAARAARIPISEAQIKARLQVMLNSQGNLPEHLLRLWQQPKELYDSLLDTGHADNAKAIFERLEQDLKNYEAYQALAERLKNASQSAELDNAFRQLLWQWFEQKLIVIHDPYTPGNQIIKRISAITPPGFLNRIMGMQNIKGTGLDFVYRWQAWETCHKAATKIKSQNLRTAEEGLNALATFKEYGPLSEEYVRQVITEVKDTPNGQLAQFQTNFTLILSNLQLAMAEINVKGEDESETGGFWRKLIMLIEAFLDAGDAVKRRKKADQIYKDMVTERISHQTAALEVQKLNKRQKGGWLSAIIEGWRRRRS